MDFFIQYNDTSTSILLNSSGPCVIETICDEVTAWLLMLFFCIKSSKFFVCEDASTLIFVPSHTVVACCGLNVVGARAEEQSAAAALGRVDAQPAAQQLAQAVVEGQEDGVGSEEPEEARTLLLLLRRRRGVRVREGVLHAAGVVVGG